MTQRVAFVNRYGDTVASRSKTRWLLLLLILVAFGRLVYRLDARDLWLDEVFSLQRAEASWPAVVSGGLKVADTLDAMAVTDPHPFGYYALLKPTVSLFGSSEFALRFSAVIAATLLVPAAWALARLLARRGILPSSTPWWAVLLVAMNPFYLWYGQEARMYALVALLAILSTFMLLRWLEVDVPRGRRGWWLAGYGGSIFLLLTSHFFSLFILPVHAAATYMSLAPRNRRQALGIAAIILALALVPAIAAVWLIVREPGAVGHFAKVSPTTLISDLFSTFATGLTMKTESARVVGLACAVLAVLGMVRGWSKRRQEGAIWWLLPAWFLVPTLFVAVINAWRPAYMTVRQMTLISGAYLLLVSGGIAWLWQRQRWIGALVAVGLVGTMLSSSATYYRSPDFDKGDLSGMGDTLRHELRPGDLVLVEPSSWWRLFKYYLPLPDLRQGASQGLGTDWHEVALPGSRPEDVEAQLQGWDTQYQRIWLARAVGQSATSQWLGQHNCRIWDLGFESPISYLRLELFQAHRSIPNQLPGPGAIQYPFSAVLADQVRLLGYDLGQPVARDSAVPITLYWQAIAPIDRHYKYKVRLVSAATGEQVAVTEREPFDGCWPTTQWLPGETVVERTGLHSPGSTTQNEYLLTFQLYDAETLDLLPVTQAIGIQMEPDGRTLDAPHTLTWPPVQSPQ